MYQCRECNGLFHRPGTTEKDYDSTVEVDVCPFCGCKEFDWFYWDGKLCPYCGEEIDFTNIEDEENYEYTCKVCKIDIWVKKGLLQDDQQ